MRKSLVIGITGGSGSGKTLLLKHLLTHFSEKEVCQISQDNYYKPRNQQPIDDQGVKNFDLPESLELEIFAKDIQRLIRGETIEIEEYMYNNPDAPKKYLRFVPAPVIIVEGLFIFDVPGIFQQLDIKIFIETDYHLMMKRRIIRDNKERGYDLKDVLCRFEKHVMPSFEKHILPHRKKSDIIIPNNTDFKVALDFLTGYIRHSLNQE